MADSLTSMTGFAARQGDDGEVRWTWEIRSVNSRGLDLRLRLPEGFEALEPPLRTALAAVCQRGAVTVTLRVQRAGKLAPLMLDRAQLERVLAAARLVEERAEALGLTLRESSAAELLALRGLLEPGPLAERDDAELLAALAADIPPLVGAFSAARAAEGAALAGVIGAQLDQIAGLVARAAEAAEARKESVAEALRANLRAILDAAEGLDEGRIAQELALLAVKSDITEEIDRLRTHVAAARALLAADGPAGRKLDFLTQEFNREANTLCAKAGAAALTAIGLELKAVIDRMREQVQNVE